MKITYLLTTADEMGGTERTVFTQANQLAGRHDVRVISIFRTRAKLFFDLDPRVRVSYLVDRTGTVERPVRDSGLGTADCARLAALPSRLVDPAWEPAFDRLTDLEAEHALRETDTDILVSTTPALMAVVAQTAPARTVTVHQEHRVAERRGASGDPLLQFAPRFDAMVLLTRRTQAWLAESLGPRAPRLEVIPNGLPDSFRPRSSLESRSVVLAGRLVSEKQVDHAIRAFATVVPDHPDWTLKIFGEGPLRPRLRRQIEDLELHDTVRLLGSSAHLAEEWAKASIALCTSRVEAFGLVLVEAQAAGVPVVSYDCPNGPSEIVTEGVDGFLVPPGDTVGLGHALGRLMSDRALRHSFGHAALKASERFGVSLVAERWEDLFGALLTERDGTGRADLKARRLAHHALLTASGDLGRAALAPPGSGVGVRTRRALEDRIEASRPDLTRTGGQVCRIFDSETPFDIVKANLDLAVAVLEAAGVPYIVVKDGAIPYTVGVHEQFRPAVLATLARQYAREAVYVTLVNERNAATATTLAALAEAVAGDYECAGLRVYQPTVTPSGTLRLGGVYACTIDFWSEPEDDPDSFRLLRRSRIGHTVPKSALLRGRLRIGDRDYPTIKPFERTFVQELSFPIDAVYTWVDGTGPDWLARKNAELTVLGLPPVGSAAGNARFRDRDELRYSLRSVDMYAPWIRNIYIVTDRQVPSWLDTSHPRVRIVDHRDIFQNRGRLPTYNSHAIESRLHHIDGLSEHFLYLNDDVFFGRPVLPEVFFLPNGQAKFFQSPTPVPPTPVSDEDEFNISAAKNNRALIEDLFGHTPAQTFLHAPHPLRRSVLNDIEQRFPEAVEQTAAAQLRSRTDLSIASSLHHTYGYFTSRSVPGAVNCGFVNVGLREHHTRLTRILSSRPHDVFCLNDYHDGDVPEEEQSATLHAFLTSYFPIASAYETGSERNRRLHRGRLPDTRPSGPGTG
ncbi:stealth conserved region 3 domain-containing protein [Streptomyces sp. NBRC 110611]|uniref:stealth conserved region 3 domain-containing protein n=1 Tax=Streptomyces sp. NBRC 110611 TaxID=1621259 RepID=UPI000835079F|nr:stealth conserved region 3 domain-containing protein [Streptomyces sp. NBRC 110611]